VRTGRIRASASTLMGFPESYESVNFIGTASSICGPQTGQIVLPFSHDVCSDLFPYQRVIGIEVEMYDCTNASNANPNAKESSANQPEASRSQVDRSGDFRTSYGNVWFLSFDRPFEQECT
jgi:hypothetical protein